MEKGSKQIGSVEAVRNLLVLHGVNFSSWGKNATKTVENLAHEVTVGESCLEVDAEGRLIRKISVACIEVYGFDGCNNAYQLIEIGQVWPDGRHRERRLPNSVSEKIKANEEPLDGAIRGLREELGLVVQAERLVYKHVDADRRESSSYPRLRSHLHRYWFEYYLPPDEFRQYPEGFVEDSGEKKTVFKWKRL